MRPIISSINSPSYLVAKWLQKKLTKLTPFQSFSVKNRDEFIESIKDITLNEDEYLVSFDVVGLYPNVPIETTTELIKDWLHSNNLSKEEIQEYTNLISLCMSQTTFSFQDKFYTQTNGTAMGNPISCFVANIFMSHFENLIKATLPYFPRVWLRYVDDVFAIFNKKQDIQQFIDQINNIYPSIKFTHEIESNGKLPFLDVLVIKSNNAIEFDIYRKSTHTDRYITNDSNHPPHQKRAVFNSLIYRLLHTPLNKERFSQELKYIKHVADFNGYSMKLIDSMLKKAKRKEKKKNQTKLVPLTTKESNWTSITYHSNTANNIERILKKKTSQKISFRPINLLKSKLQNPKDKTLRRNMSGIYEIDCSECEKKYIGQSRRAVNVRFKEHVAHAKYGRAEKSAVAAHSINTGHSFNIENLKLLKQIVKPQYLNAWESYFISSENRNLLLNNEDGPIINSKLLNLIISKS